MLAQLVRRSLTHNRYIKLNVPRRLGVVYLPMTQQVAWRSLVLYISRAHLVPFLEYHLSHNMPGLLPAPVPSKTGAPAQPTPRAALNAPIRTIEALIASLPNMPKSPPLDMGPQCQSFTRALGHRLPDKLGIIVANIRQGYPRFSALMASHPSFLMARRFSVARIRLLLHKQDEVAVIEEQLEAIDKAEPCELFLGNRRRDRNEARIATMKRLDAVLEEYGMHKHIHFKGLWHLSKKSGNRQNGRPLSGCFRARKPPIQRRRQSPELDTGKWSDS